MSEISGAHPHAGSASSVPTSPSAPATLPDGAGVWLVTRYADARAGAGRPAAVQTGSPAASLRNRAGGPTSHHMLNSDPPDHTRLRRLVAGVHRPAGRRLAPADRSRSPTSCWTRWHGRGRGRPDRRASPSRCRSRSSASCSACRRTTRTRSASWSNTIVSGGPGEDPSRAAELRDALGQLVALPHRTAGRQARAAPADDLLSALIGARDEDGPAHRGRAASSMVFLLLIAGHETTVNLIGNGVVPAADPSRPAATGCAPTRGCCPARSRSCCATTARCRPPPSASPPSRSSTAASTIPAGEPVLISLLSANRDAAVFTDADRLRLGRDATPATSPSATASTSAWARRWPGWRAGSRSARCCTGSRGCGWPSTRTSWPGGPGCSSGGWSSSRYGSCSAFLMVHRSLQPGRRRCRARWRLGYDPAQ